jgi:DNA polymerase-3 subunit gamma/tau
LGAIDRELLFEFSAAILEERPERIFSLVENVIASGYDLRHFYKELVQHFRNLLVVSSVIKPEDFLLFNPEELNRLKKEAEKTSSEDILRYLQALQNAEPGLRFSSHPQIYFETIMVKLCHFQKIIPLKDLLQELSETKKEVGKDFDVRPKTSWTSPAPKKYDAGVPAKDEIKSGSFMKEKNPPLDTPEALSRGFKEETSRKKEKDLDIAMKDPTVKFFMDTFKAQVLSIKSPQGRNEDEEA